MALPKITFKAERLKRVFTSKALLWTLIVILAAGAFYWFQWRPSQVRKACHTDALVRAKKKVKSKDLYIRKDYVFYYQQCLHKEGFK